MKSQEITDTNQYFTFTLGEEDFALDILTVREVLDYTTITKVPRMPEFIRGVINLRGSVVPVVDLRLKLGTKAAQKMEDTCIIIVEIDIDGELTQMGGLVDSVKAVIDLEPDQIYPPPKLGTKLKTEFIKGMGKQDEKFLIILDINRVLSSDEMALVKERNEISTEAPEENWDETETPIPPPDMDVTNASDDNAEAAP